MQLTVKVIEKTPGNFIFKPAGSIDSLTSDILEQRVHFILNSAPRSIVFDMQQIGYISSAGVRVVFKVQKEMKEKGGRFFITNMQPPVRKVFEIIHALPTLQVFESIEELDRYLDVMQKKEAEKTGC